MSKALICCMNTTIESPEVSVIVLTYNQHATIARALDSILASKCDFPYEVVIGDDASTDGTREICQRYVDKYPDRVRLMPSARNKGIVDNYFDCFEACRGKYVMDCAGDDYWVDARRMQLQREAFNRGDDIVAVSSDWEIEDAASHSVVRSTDMAQSAECAHSMKGQDLMLRLLGGFGQFPIILSAVMYRKDVIDAVYNANRSMIRNAQWQCEDLPIMVALAAAGDFEHVPIVSMRYVSQSDTVSNRGNSAKLFDFYASTFEARAVMARHYGVDFGNLRKMFNHTIHYLTALSFDMHDTVRYRRTRELSDLWQLSLPLPTLIYRFLMSADWLWSVALRLKKILKR